MLEEVLSIIERIIDHSSNISIWLIVASVTIAFSIGIAEYKSMLLQYITNRRNKWWFVVLLVALAGILSMKEWMGLSGLWLIFCSGLWAIYGVVCIQSMKPKVFHHFSNIVLRYLEKTLYEGSAIEHVDYFRAKKHWYLWTRKDKLEYRMLSAMYFQEVNEIQMAYQAINGIDPKWLYLDEKKEIDSYKALFLVQMGSMKTALSILGEPEKNESNDPTTWMAYAFIAENAGDVDAGYSLCEKAKTLLERDGAKLTKVMQGEIYNNFSRYALMKGNTEESLYALERAWEKVKDSGDMRIISIVASNRIIRKAIAGKSKAECEKALDEYKKVVPENRFANQIEVHNCEIAYYRQIGEESKEYEIIKTGFLGIVDKLTPSQKVCFTQSTFIMLMNGHYDYTWLASYISTSEKVYKALSIMERLTVFKGYMGIFQREEFRAICKKKPYKDLNQLIMRYYEREALSEIEELLGKTESYEVYQYLELSAQRLGILKLLEGKDHIEKSEKSYVNLYQELYEKGLHIDAIRILTTLIDECSSPYNILIWSPLWGDRPAMLYSDYIEHSVPPDPILLKDGIHLEYAPLGIYPFTQIRPLREDVIRKYIDIILDEIKKWKNHPAKVDLSIEIAHLLLCIDRKDEAREMFEFFKGTGVSAYHFSSWMKEEVQALSKELYE